MPDHTGVKRRTALLGIAGAFGAVSLTGGCDTGEDIGAPPAPGTETSAPRDEPGPTAQPSVPKTGDQELVEGITQQLSAALGVALQTRRRVGSTSGLTALIATHREHLKTFEGAGATLPATQAPAPAAAWRTLRRNEEQLRYALTEAAIRAESPALAGALASMSASVAQHLATLPREVPR